MATDRKEMKAFWRDDAKLWWLQPEERAKMWITILGTVLACTLLLLFGESIGVNQVYARLFIAVAGVFMFPLGAAVEMYNKGGKAGAELANKLNDLESEDPAVQDEQISAVMDAHQRLSEILANDQLYFPKAAGPRAEVERASADAVARLKTDACDCLETCDSQTAGKYKKSLRTDRIKSLSDRHAVLGAIRDAQVKIMVVVERMDRKAR